MTAMSSGAIKKTALINYLLLLTTIVFWASAFVGIRMGLKSYTPGALALLRYGIASMAIIPLYLKYRSHYSLTKTELATAFLAGFLGIGFYNAALNYGELTVPAGIASFTIGQVPIFTALLALFLLKEKLSISGWIGIFISMIGIAIIAISQSNALSFNMGVIYILLAAFASSLFIILQKPLLKKINAIEFVSIAIWSGTASLLIFLPSLPHQLIHASLQSTCSVIYLSICPGVIAYITWSMALKRLTAVKASSFLYVTPIVSTFLGWIILKENISLLSFVGGCVALVGSIIVQKK
ncbi:MAG TPA: hypothetical protein DIC51_04620 [Coxiellaceae bacterium]|nr:hypothetical protein [Coxiellaceae bacterium]